MSKCWCQASWSVEELDSSCVRACDAWRKPGNRAFLTAKGRRGRAAVAGGGKNTSDDIISTCWQVRRVRLLYMDFAQSSKDSPAVATTVATVAFVSAITVAAAVLLAVAFPVSPSPSPAVSTVAATAAGAAPPGTVQVDQKECSYV